MGQGLRFTRTPDGRTMTTGAANEYMHDVYLPQQDFNASANMPIPGVTGSYGSGANIPRPGQPAYAMPEAQPLPGGTPMNPSGSGGGSGWGTGAGAQNMMNGMVAGLLAGQPSTAIPMGQGLPMAQQPVARFDAPGAYGQQAMGMAGLLSPHTPPDTYPNGLLGGKRPFRPGGK